MSFTKDAEKDAFAAWLSLPPDLRDPASQNEWAAKHGVHPSTLSNWKREPEFMREVRRARKRNIGEKMSEVIDAVYREATENRNVQAAKLLMEYAEEHTDRLEVTNVAAGGGGLDTIGPEVWAFIAHRIAAHPQIRAAGLSPEGVEKIISESLSDFAPAG